MADSAKNEATEAMTFNLKAGLKIVSSVSPLPFHVRTGLKAGSDDGGVDDDTDGPKAGRAVNVIVEESAPGTAG